MNPDTAMMMELMTRLWPLHRTLVSDDMDRTLDIIGEYLPPQGEYRIHRYPSGQKVWTWTVPEKFVVEEAYLELLTEQGPRRVADFADNPLHLVSYSPRFEGELSFAELEPHLHTNPARPHALPWVFKYYARDWGFCLSHDEFMALPRDGRYRAVVRTRFDAGHLGVGEYTLEGSSGEYFLIVCATCHPMQVNDSISGVVTAVDLVRRRAGLEAGYYGIKVLFLPETVGSVAFLANNEHLIDRFPFAVFTEFVGNDHRLRLQRSRQDDHLIDRVARFVLKSRTGGDFVEGGYCHTIITNDEKVTNAPGVNIPTIALNRWPDDGWELYHTSDDNPAAMVPEKLAEVSALYDDILDIMEAIRYPRRTFRGPLFLSGVDFGFDWLANRTIKRGVQDIMQNLEGDLSTFDLAEMLGMDFDMVRRAVAAMERQGFVVTAREPWTS